MASKFAELEQKCKKTIEHFKKELGRVRTGRASSALLEGVHVEYYGSSVPLQQLGMINAPEPRLLTVQVYDGGAAEAVDRAIRAADLGLNPSRDGNLIRIAIPSLTEERRKEFVKRLHKMGEENKVVVRNHRRDEIEALKKKAKDKTISEDDSHRGQEEIQKITDRVIGELDVLMQAKEKEILDG